MDRSIVILASSLGGPPLVNEVLSSLPRNFDLPILVLQYMESDFSEPLTAAWSKGSALSLTRLNQEEKMLDGRAYVIPYNMYTVFESHGLNSFINPRVIGSECNAGSQWSRVIDECVKYFGDSIYLVMLTDYGIRKGALEHSLAKLREAGGNIIYCSTIQGIAAENQDRWIDGDGSLEMEIDQIIMHLQKLSESKQVETKEL